jgi:hypothetical protein
MPCGAVLWSHNLANSNPAIFCMKTRQFLTPFSLRIILWKFLASIESCKAGAQSLAHANLGVERLARLAHQGVSTIGPDAAASPT